MSLPALLQHITKRHRRFRASWAHASELSVAAAAAAAAVDSAIRCGQPPHTVMYLTHVSDSAEAAADTACAALTAAMFGRAGRPALHRLRSAGTSAVPAAHSEPGAAADDGHRRPHQWCHRRRSPPSRPVR